MLNRKIDGDIEKHFASSKKALFLTGARRMQSESMHVYTTCIL